MSYFFHLVLLLSLSLNMPTIPSSWRAGVYAEDADTGEILYNFGGESYFRPASTVKLLTTLVAMKELGPSYVYETRIMADTADNNLFIVGAGAPLLSAEHIRIVALETAAFLDPDSSWDLFWDTTRFTSESHNPGWDTSDWSRMYCPPIEGLSVGDNILQLIISTRGDTMRVFYYPPLPGLEIENNLVTGTRESVRANVEGWTENRPLIILEGMIPPDTQLVLYKPFAGPPAEFAGMLAVELEAAGLNINQVMQRKTPDSASLVQTSVIFSDPMFVLLTSMNKWSRNMVAEMVLRTASLETGSNPASTGAGCDVTGQLLRDIVPSLTGFQIADGSGLSRFNSLTPIHLARILSEGISSAEWGVEFLATLPVNGVDGTLRSRMADLPPGAFRGKTGTLNDTSAIAGLLTSSSGRRIVLVIMFEVPRGQTWTARGLQDNMVSWFWENY
ncbi:MAG: D-alanyl-D-alanine carboxypeptidase/D-alanyl-D-alanine-endopeptidase [Candidatus Aegiribacteria sp.]|nr:D-alanyl-D-alanine carboxypeptidase/D-alanyl-D-alanine-endopeptidase [Candidatus Aegiribacteria sp.]